VPLPLLRSERLLQLELSLVQVLQLELSLVQVLQSELWLEQGLRSGPRSEQVLRWERLLGPVPVLASEPAGLQGQRSPPPR
jgi:hypothetical protein